MVNKMNCIIIVIIIIIIIIIILILFCCYGLQSTVLQPTDDDDDASCCQPAVVSCQLSAVVKQKDLNILVTKHIRITLIFLMTIFFVVIK